MSKRKTKKVEKPLQRKYFEEPVFKHKHKLYYKIGESPVKFFVIDLMKIRTSEATLVKENPKDKTNTNYVEKHKEIYGNFVLQNWTKYIPLFQDIPVRYSCKLKIRGNTTIQTFEGNTIDKMKSEFKANAITRTRNHTDIVINSSISLYKDLDAMKTSKLPPFDGFFWIDGKLECSNEDDFDVPTIEEMEAALDMLEEYVADFDEFRGKASYIVRWLLMAPFSFAKRQKGCMDKLGAIYVYGTSRAGKSMLGYISGHIWQRDIQSQVMKGADNLNTPATFAHQISKSTYPIIVDEGEEFFKNSRRGNPLLSLIKNAILQPIARGRYGANGGDYSTSLSLNPLYISSNVSKPNKAELGARLSSYHFRLKKARTAEERLAFDEKFQVENMGGPLSVLKGIGNYVATHVLTNQEIIDMNWLEASTQLLDEMYSYCGREMPEWLKEFDDPEGYEDAFEEEESDLISNFQHLVLRNEGPYLHSNLDNSNYLSTTSIHAQKALDVAYSSTKSWLSIRKVRQGPNKGEEMVTIGIGITNEFEKEFGRPVSLPILEDKLNGKMNRITMAKKKMSVVQWTINDFIDIFDGEDRMTDVDVSTQNDGDSFELENLL